MDNSCCTPLHCVGMVIMLIEQGATALMLIEQGANQTYTTTDGSRPVYLAVMGKCRRVFYCSKECQVADWRIHKKSCAKMTS